MGGASILEPAPAMIMSPYQKHSIITLLGVPMFPSCSWPTTLLIVVKTTRLSALLSEAPGFVTVGRCDPSGKAEDGLGWSIASRMLTTAGAHVHFLYSLYRAPSEPRKRVLKSGIRPVQQLALIPSMKQVNGRFVSPAQWHPPKALHTNL